MRLEEEASILGAAIALSVDWGQSHACESHPGLEGAVAVFHAHSLFERALLASDLISQQRLAGVVSSLSADGSDRSDLNYDALLGRRLVELELLNEWQVDQLREGRSKFTLGPYVILDSIGKGGMGHVFKGQHELLGRVEAIKVLPRAKSTPEAIAAFRHEIRAQARLDHPNLVRVSYADRDRDTYFLVTEYVPGVDLRRVVRRCGPLTPDQAALVVMQASKGLDHAHRRGLVHRDVKPGNLLVTPEGEVKVADLGLAWFLEPGVPTPPNDGRKIVGTCDYLAPESIQEPDRIIPVSDIYSLGCTLYYAVTGKVPYPGGNPMEKMKRRLQEAPINPRAFNPALPLELVDLIGQMMDKNADRRTPNASTVAEQLAPIVQQSTRSTLAALVQSYLALPRSRDTGAASDSGQTGTPREIGETIELDASHEALAEQPHQAQTAPHSSPARMTPVSEIDSGERRSPLDRAVWGIVAIALAAVLAILLAAALNHLLGS